MNRKSSLLALSLLLLAGTVVAGVTITPAVLADAAAKRTAAGLTVTALRCAYRVDPLNITTPQPRLFWQVTGTGRGQRQTAYRILAASSRENLEKDNGDLWDSNKVMSSETIQIPYTGKPLTSGEQVFWKVATWDEGDKQSGWSRPATWTMGLLEPAAWTARWISKTTSPETAGATLDGASWIWHRADGVSNPPAGTRFFRTTVNLPADAALPAAHLYISADDHYTVTVNGSAAHVGPTTTDSWRNFQDYDVRRELRAGPNTILIEARNLTASPAGAIAKLAIRSRAGDQTVATGADWESAASKDGPFAPVAVVGPLGVQPWGKLNFQVAWDRTPPYFRKEFTVARPVKRALLYATAMGVYELSLNGKRVGTDYLSPGWTDFHKRVRYLTYDVTGQVRQGGNALGAILGDGWYASFLAFTGRNHWYGGEPKLRLQLNVEYADGSKETVGTDNTWKMASGPVTYGDMLMGCTTDTRKVMPGWDSAGFKDDTWKPAVVQADPAIALDPQTNEPIRVTGTMKARTRTEPKKGVYIYDVGQNMVGWVRLTVNGKAGATVTVRHAERLNPDGTIYTTNLRSAKATDTYILSGGKQTLEPKFTFHGFQYIEVSGVDEPPAPGDVVGVVASSDLDPTLKFDSDNPLLNRLVQNIDWGWRGNSLDVPTDCPQRDERAGWMGDAQVFAKTSMFHRFSASFYTKWMYDIEDGQLPDGGYPDVAPSILGGGNAAWEDAGIVIPYRMYEMYGDTDIIRTHWASMNRFMEHLAKVAPDGIRSAGAYGDWLLLSGPQQSDIHGTAYYYFSARLMSKMALAIGEKADAEKYDQLAGTIRTAFQQRFVGADGKVTDKGRESQTFYALALAWDLLPKETDAPASANLVRMLGERSNHLATGFIGTPVLLEGLENAGYADRANALVMTETYPSWLYQVKIGATTMWERWDGWTPEKGYQDAGMNSFNHYWLGCVGEWLYTGMAGIDTDGPGWSHVTIRPQTKNAPNRVRCTYDSIRGTVECSWSRTPDGTLTVDVTIPANVTATVILPADALSKVTESERQLMQSPGISEARLIGPNRSTTMIITVGSGKYRFQVKP